MLRLRFLVGICQMLIWQIRHAPDLILGNQRVSDVFLADLMWASREVITKS
jgi:hypothetical protein